MTEKLFLDYLQECFDNDIPISFITVVNTIKGLGYNVRYRNPGRTMTNTRTNEKMKNIVNLMIIKNEKVRWNLWLGFIDYDSIIVCQLYSMDADYRSINRQGRLLFTHYDFIKRKITDEEKEQLKL